MQVKNYDKWWKEGGHGVEYDFKWKWPVIKRILPSQNSTILDFGCGEGKYIGECLRVNSYKIIGIDVSKYAISKAKKKFPNARFYSVFAGEKIPVRSGTVDFVLAGDVIEHVLDVMGFVSELNRVLKKGGRIFISTPYHGTIKNIVISLIGFDIAFNPLYQHIRFFTKKSLTKILEDNGFKILEYNQYGRFKPVSRGMYFIAEKRK